MPELVLGNLGTFVIRANNCLHKKGGRYMEKILRDPIYHISVSLLIDPNTIWNTFEFLFRPYIYHDIRMVVEVELDKHLTEIRVSEEYSDKHRICLLSITIFGDTQDMLKNLEVNRWLVTKDF